MHTIYHLGLWCSVVLFFGGAPLALADTWTALSSGATNDLNTVACPDERTCYVAGGAPIIGGSGVMLKTTNGGATWVSQSLPVTNPLRGVSCVSTTVCFAAGDGGALLKTTNGSTWVRLGAGTPAAEQYYWDIDAYDALNATAVGNAGVIFRTANGGATWTRITPFGGTVANLHGVYFVGASVGWIVGSGGTTLKTINGGVNWLPLDTPSGANLLWDVFSIDGLRAWVSGDSMLRSTNGGVDWTRGTTDMSVTYRGIRFVDNARGWIVGGGGVVHTTSDGGAHWTRESSPTTVILRGIECPATDLCYAIGDDGVILRRGTPPEEAPPPGTSSGPRLSPQALRRVAEAVNARLFQDNLNDEQKRIAEGPSKGNSATKRKRGVSINPNILSQNQIGFNLFADTELIGLLERRAEGPHGTKIWKGTIEGKPTSKATLITKGNITVGNIHTDEGVYEIRYAGNGATTIRLVDTKRLPEDKHLGVPAPRVTARATPPPPAEAVAIADTMILFTPDAYNDIGNDIDAAGALATLMIEEANSAYENSNVGFRLRWAHVEILNDLIYNDSGDLEDDINTLSAEFPAFRNYLQPFAQSRREEHNPDLVTLVVKDGGGACGIAWQMNATNESSFGAIADSVVDIDCISNYVYAHELGHGMGAQHNSEDADATPRYSYAYGYQDPQERFRTIMAYQCADAPCTRIPFFSSPNMLYQGIPFGTATQDNARTLQNTRFVVANYSEVDEGGGAASADVSADAAARDLATSAGVSAPASAPGALRLFFRNVGRETRTLFTFNPGRKADLRLRYANEKMLEAQQFAKVGDEDKTVGRLAASQKDLDKVEALTKHVLKSQKEQGETLRTKLIDQGVYRHELLRTLERHAKPEAKEKIRATKDKEVDRIASLVVETNAVEAFVEKLEKQPAEKVMRGFSILERIKDKDPQKTKDVVHKAEKNILEKVAAQKAERMKSTDRVAEFLIDIRKPNLERKNVFDGLRKNITILNSKVVAAEQENQKKSAVDTNSVARTLAEIRQTSRTIGHALSKIEAREVGVTEVSEIIRRMRDLAVQASSETLAADEREYIEEEFSQLNAELTRMSRLESPLGGSETLSVEVSTDGTKHDSPLIISLDFDDVRPTIFDLTSLSGRISGRVAVMEKVLERFDTEIEELKDILEKFEGALTLQFAKLERLVGELRPPGDFLGQQVDSEKEKSVCTQEYRPVCGSDGKTYSNRCVAEQQNEKKVAYEGECVMKEQAPSPKRRSSHYP